MGTPVNVGLNIRVLALTIDKSFELAQREADELTEMITAMTKRLSA